MHTNGGAVMMRRGQRLIVNNGSASVCASMTIKVLNTIFVTAVFLVALVSAGHALLTKRDPKGAWGWIAVSLAFPFFGPLLYFFFGIITSANKYSNNDDFVICNLHGKDRWTQA